MTKISKNKLNRIYKAFEERYNDYSDPWGLDIKKHKKILQLLLPLYQHYFKVKVHGAQKVLDEPYIVVANHSGQVAIDAILLCFAFVLEVSHPRLLRGMVDRFVAQAPFLGSLAAEMGLVLGDRTNSLFLLDKKESLMVFPEGMKGITKNTKDFYHLQKFTSGFFRMAIESKTKILPIAIVGAEEFYPYVYHSKLLAKILKLPAFPLTPTFPLLGLLGMLPLPSPVDIYIGDPYEPPKDLNFDSPDNKVDNHVENIKIQISEMIDLGLKRKRPIFTKK